MQHSQCKILLILLLVGNWCTGQELMPLPTPDSVTSYLPYVSWVDLKVDTDNNYHALVSFYDKTSLGEGNILFPYSYKINKETFEVSEVRALPHTEPVARSSGKSYFFGDNSIVLESAYYDSNWKKTEYVKLLNEHINVLNFSASAKVASLYPSDQHFSQITIRNRDDFAYNVSLSTGDTIEFYNLQTPVIDLLTTSTKIYSYYIHSLGKKIQASYLLYDTLNDISSGWLTFQTDTLYTQYEKIENPIGPNLIVNHKPYHLNSVFYEKHSTDIDTLEIEITNLIDSTPKSTLFHIQPQAKDASFSGFWRFPLSITYAHNHYFVLAPYKYSGPGPSTYTGLQAFLLNDNLKPVYSLELFDPNEDRFYPEHQTVSITPDLKVALIVKHNQHLFSVSQLLIIDVNGNVNSPYAKTHVYTYSKSVYPNPAKETIYLEAKEIPLNHRAFNLAGKEVHLSFDHSTLSFDVSQLPRGVYFLYTQWPDGKTEHQKFVKF